MTTNEGVPWSLFEAAASDLAAAGRRLLYQFGPGLAFLATVRADGGPRVHPVCPHLAEGELWIMIAPTSPKRADLERDGRYALHTFPCVDVDDEFYVTGRAVRVDDPETRAQVVSSFISNTTDQEILFRFALERVLLSTYGARPSFPPKYTRWRASD